jgi:hypothetical protein
MAKAAAQLGISQRSVSEVIADLWADTRLQHRVSASGIPPISRDRHDLARQSGSSAKNSLGTRASLLRDAVLPRCGLHPRRGARPEGRAAARTHTPRDTFGDDFRVVQAAEFPGDKREIMDFRPVEGIAGKTAPEVLAAKMANTIAQN